MNTENLDLVLTGRSATNLKFEDWRMAINGDEGDSNMQKIDDAFGDLDAGKLDKSGGTVTGDITMSGSAKINLSDVTISQDKVSGTSAEFDQITINENPSDDTDAVNKKYVDDSIADIPTITIDTHMSSTSTNTVQNKVIKQYVDEHTPTIVYDNQMSSTSENGVKNRVIKKYVDDTAAEKLDKDGGTMTGDLTMTYGASIRTGGNVEISDFSVEAMSGAFSTATVETVNSGSNSVTNKQYVDEAVSDAEDELRAIMSPNASTTNKLVSASEMGDAISTVEAKHLYATATQGSFANHAALVAATTYYNADGTVATPTKNDVAYVLSDETHNDKSAKYVIASVDPVVWGFVISFSDTTFTQAQMNAINSNMTDGKRQSYDTHIADNTIHVTEEEKESWDNKLDKISGATTNNVATFDSNGGVKDSDVGISQLARINGFYEQMAVGLAQNLISPDGVSETPENNSDHNPFIYRTTAGEKSISDGYADIVAIRGNTCKWNQYVRNGDFASTNNWYGKYCDMSADNNELTATVTNAVAGNEYMTRIFQNTSIEQNHKCLLSAEVYHTKKVEWRLQISSSSTKQTEVLIQQEYDVKENQWNKLCGVITSGTLQRIDVLFNYGMAYNTGDIVKIRNCYAIDLTEWFGEGREPDTYEDAIRRGVPDHYITYCEPAISNVNPKSYVTVGFNQWDEQWELGGYDNTTGAPITSTTTIRSKNAISVINGSVYYANTGDEQMTICFYDHENHFLSAITEVSSDTFNTPDNAAYIRFCMNDDYGTEYSNDICINLSWTGYRNGEYEPYEKNERQIAIDTYFPNGLSGIGDSYDCLYRDKYINRVAKINLWELDWTMYHHQVFGNYFYADLSDVGIKYIGDYTTTIYPILTNKYTVAKRTAESFGDKRMCLDGSDGYVSQIQIKDSDYSNATAFKASLNSEVLYCEMAEPKIVPIDPPLNFSVKVYDFGTEEWVYDEDDAPVLVPCEMYYQNNLVDYLRSIRDLTVAEMDEVIAALG